MLFPSLPNLGDSSHSCDLMSQPDETPTSNLLPSPSSSFDIPSSTYDLPAGPSIEKRPSHLDQVFNFQIVVFEVYFLYSNLHIRNR